MKLTVCDSIPSSLEVYARLVRQDVPENTNSEHEHVAYSPNSLISTTFPYFSHLHTHGIVSNT